MMRRSYAIGADEWYSIDVTLDPLGISYADILVFGSKGTPKAYGFTDRNMHRLLCKVLNDMDLYHVKIADILKFKTGYREHVLECGCAENRMKSSRKVQS